jgi:hypothetical protein
MYVATGISYFLTVASVSKQTLIKVTLITTCVVCLCRSSSYVDYDDSVHCIRPFTAVQTPVPCRRGSKKIFYGTVYGDPVTVLVP